MVEEKQKKWSSNKKAANPPTLATLVRRYLRAAAIRNLSEHTVTARMKDLKGFVEWCEERSIERPAEVTKTAMNRYQRHLHNFRKPNGRPLAVGTRYNRLINIRLFF